MNEQVALAWLPRGAGFGVAIVLGVIVAVTLREILGRTAAGQRTLRVVHAVEGGFVALLLATMLVLSFLQIVLRNLFQTGLVWIDPLLRHLLLWIGFTGGAVATRLARHITVDALTRMMSERLRRWARVATHLAACIVCFILAWAALEVVREEAAAATTTFLDLPTWKLQAVMPVALVLMAYRFLRQTVDAALGRVPAEEVGGVPALEAGMAPADATPPIGGSGRA